jgi:hypothetical protein
MPLRLDNAKCVAHMPTAEQQQQKNKPVEPQFKIDHAASPMPETRQPERLAPRATSNRNGGRDHLGILGEIKSVHPGEIIGISTIASDARPFHISRGFLHWRFAYAGPTVRAAPPSWGRHPQTFTIAKSSLRADVFRFTRFTPNIGRYSAA